MVCVQGRGPEESELEFDEECMAGSDIEQLGRKVNALIPQKIYFS